MDGVTPCADCGAQAGYIQVAKFKVECVACHMQFDPQFIFQTTIYPRPEQLAFWGKEN
jgi:hypothetical protein